MTITPPVIKLYYYTGAAWVDITAYMQTTNISGSWGHSTAEHTDRLADTGEMTVTLKNYAGEFDPDDADCLTGWGINTPLRFTITYDGTEYVRFYGTVPVGGIRYCDLDKFTHFANVTIADYLNYIYQYPLTLPSIELDKRGDEALSTIITAIGKTPLATEYSEGVNTFPAVFDTVSANTKAGTEINKILLSEMGYFYARKDKVHGETLVFESANDRHGLRTVKRLPKLIADCSHIVDEDGLYITDENGNHIIGNEDEDAHINSTETSFTRSHGDNIINRVVITAYPKEVDPTETILYKLDSPIKLASGETKTVKGGYTNATTKKSCNAISSTMVTPVATTDYTMNKAKDGTGTNLTANLTVAASFYTATVEFTLTNTSAYTAWVRKLNARGYGVYQNTTLEETLNDTASQTAYAMSELKLDQKYQRDTANGVAEGAKILENSKVPATRLETYTMFANTSSQHMMAFLHVDIGDLVQITESEANVAGYYYVQGVSFSVQSGNIIQFTWVLKEAFPLIGKLTAPTIGLVKATSGRIVFPPIASINDAEILTWIVSVNIHTLPESGFPGDVIIKNSAFGETGSYGMGGQVISYRTLGENSFIDLKSYDGDSTDNYDNWRGPDDILSLDTWYRIAVIYNKVKQTCLMYVDGSLVSTNNQITGTGQIVSHSNFLRIGCEVLDSGKLEGFVRDARVYSVALTASEIAADSAGTIIERGLQFAGPYVKDEDVTYFTDHSVVSTDRFFDGMHGAIGVPVVGGGYPITSFPE